MLAFFILIGALDSQTPAAPELAHDHFGVCIADAGDLDGDGLHDLWVGDPSRRDWQQDTVGKVWAISTRDGATLLRIDSPAESRDFGWSVAALGDTDADGVADVAVGCLRAVRAGVKSASGGLKEHVPDGEGAVYVHSGRDGALRFVVRGAAERVKFPAETTAGGPALTSVGDWNEDGVDDLAIGWSYGGEELRAAGMVEVVSGRDGSRIHAWTGDAAYDRFGFSVLSLPDLDGDGKRELAAGAVQSRGFQPDEPDAMRRARAGYVRILSAQGVVLRTLYPYDGSPTFGFSLATMPALSPNAIGAELLVGQAHDPNSKLVVTRWNLADGLPTQFLERPALDDWDGGWMKQNAYPVEKELARSFGTRILAVPDRDGDGLADVLITEPQTFCNVPAGVMSSGRGRFPNKSSAGKPLGRVELGRPGPAYSDIGIGLCAIGDLDGDGFEDFVLSGASTRCAHDCEGTVVLVSGKTLKVLRLFTRPKDA